MPGKKAGKINNVTSYGQTGGTTAGEVNISGGTNGGKEPNGLPAWAQWLIGTATVIATVIAAIALLAQCSPSQDKDAGGTRVGDTFNVNSYGQQGGITAGQVNIGKQPRTLTPQSGAEMLRMLRDLTFTRIDLVAVMGDGEAFSLADQIKNYLAAKGFTVDGISQAVFAGPMYDVGIIGPENGVLKIVVGHQR